MIETRFQDMFRAFDVKVVVLFSSDQPKLRGELLQPQSDLRIKK